MSLIIVSPLNVEMIEQIRITIATPWQTVNSGREIRLLYSVLQILRIKQFKDKFKKITQSIFEFIFSHIKKYKVTAMGFFPAITEKSVIPTERINNAIIPIAWGIDLLSEIANKKRKLKQIKPPNKK